MSSWAIEGGRIRHSVTVEHGDFRELEEWLQRGYEMEGRLRDVSLGGEAHWEILHLSKAAEIINMIRQRYYFNLTGPLHLLKYRPSEEIAQGNLMAAILIQSSIRCNSLAPSINSNLLYVLLNKFKKPN